jgi:hypothetical protein
MPSPINACDLLYGCILFDLVGNNERQDKFKKIEGYKRDNAYFQGAVE